PSGMTGVQTLVPVMLHHVNQNRLRFERFTELVTENPRRIFGIEKKGRIEVGYDGDFTIVDLNREWTIEDSWIQSKSQWTPFSGMKVRGKVHSTILKGIVVMEDDQLVEKNLGQALSFSKW
ncbi:MAG TPA: amidohydrolase family protein, partial [Pseudobdellovibrionaceae bacterium]|nr:amidohydrolase family protein [Pseudobdellovibrionaceae bacterium]